MGHSKLKKIERKLALEHVQSLFLEAEKQSRKNPEISDKLVTDALRILMKFQMRIPKEYKGVFCKKCKTYFIPGRNYRVRTNRGKITYTCLKCKSFIRMNMTPRKS